MEWLHLLWREVFDAAALRAERVEAIRDHFSVSARREISGRKLKDYLVRRGLGMSGPRFYFLMARLEEEGVVSGATHPFTCRGTQCRERRYIWTENR